MTLILLHLFHKLVEEGTRYLRVVLCLLRWEVLMLLKVFKIPWLSTSLEDYTYRCSTVLPFFLVLFSLYLFPFLLLNYNYICSCYWTTVWAHGSSLLKGRVCHLFLHLPAPYESLFRPLVWTLSNTELESDWGSHSHPRSHCSLCVLYVSKVNLPCLPNDALEQSTLPGSLPPLTCSLYQKVGSRLILWVLGPTPVSGRRMSPSFLHSTSPR